MVSMVRRCHDTATKPISYAEIWDATREGSHGLKGKITQIRNRYDVEKDIRGGDSEAAKKAIADLKLELPGFLPSGTFSKRSNDALVEHSGILCADLDSVGAAIPHLKDFFKSCSYVRAIAVSPSGDGLKVFFNVEKDSERHGDSFRAIKAYVLDRTGFEIDEKCKDPARICFFTYDPELWIREEGNETIPPLDPLPRATGLRPDATGLQNLTSREQTAFGLLGELKPVPEKGGYFVRCPGEAFHSNKTGEKHTILYLESVPTLSCQHESCRSTVDAFNKVLRSEIGRAESRFSHPYRDTRYETPTGNGSHPVATEPVRPIITFYSPKQLRDFVQPDNIQLIGDYHLVKDTGFVSVIGGPAGVGKSLTTTALAVAGATGEGEWFGLKIHRKFKTMIVQSENGMFRLSRNFKELDCDLLEEFVRICEPPSVGMAFRREEFYLAIRNEIAGFSPDVVILDPFNSVARDQEQRTYLETIDIVRSVLPLNTSLVIVAHTRKPQPNERAVGRSLMNVLAGSHVLATVPRSVFILQYASDDPEDDEVVWTCCKNNDGELGKRSAWKRKTGLFIPVPNFDWSTFDCEDKDKRVVITASMVQEVFEAGPLIRSLARDRLVELSGASKAATYKALSPDGRFAENLIFKGDIIDWIRKT